MLGECRDHAATGVAGGERVVGTGNDAKVESLHAAQPLELTPEVQPQKVQSGVALAEDEKHLTPVPRHRLEFARWVLRGVTGRAQPSSESRQLRASDLAEAPAARARDVRDVDASHEQSSPRREL